MIFITRVLLLTSICINLILLFTLHANRAYNNNTITAPEFNQAGFEGIKCGNDFRFALEQVGYPLAVILREKIPITLQCNKELSCYEDIFKSKNKNSEAIWFEYARQYTLSLDRKSV